MKVSNSQIMDMQKCEKRFYFAQVLKLRPNEFPEPMKRGIDGHELFETFFKSMQAGLSYEECVAALNPLLEKFIAENSPVMAVYRHILAFGARAFQEDWEVVSVEENFLTPVAVSYGDDGEIAEFAFTPDVVLRWRNGVRRGSYFMLDFKFTGQEWNMRKVAMDQQLPKYSIWWNIMNPDKKIHHLAVVNLLTRAAVGAKNDQLFRMKWLKVNKEKLATVERENTILLGRVAHIKATYKPEDYMRTVDSHACSMCFFADDICPADMEGKNIDKYIKVNYQVNTYFDDNYNKELVDV